MVHCLSSFYSYMLGVGLTCCDLQVLVMVQGLFAPWYFCSLERKFPLGTFAPTNESSRELSLPGTKVPREHSLRGAIILGSELYK